MVLLQIIFSVFGFLFSLWGIMCLLLGVTLFLLFPLVSTISRFKKPADMFLTLAAFPLKRAAFVISESNDAYFKQMKLTNLGLHEITIDSEEKLFEDPDNALHYFLGMRFTLADEEHGVFFDPRHAAVGMRKRLKDKANESVYLATEDEWESYNVAKWMPGVFELPEKHELVDLSAVQELIDGGERSEYANRVEEMYKHSRDPFGDGTPAAKFLYPIFALVVTFGGIWFMASQFGSPSSGPSDTVAFGLLYLLVSPVGILDKIKAIDWRYLGTIAFVVLAPVAAIVFLFLTVGLLTTINVVVAVTLGLLTLPILTFLTQPSKILSGALSNLYFKLGFFGYREPVITWTPTKYVVKEFDALEHTDHIEWYDQWNHTLGFSYDPEPESWGPEVISHAEIESQQPVADGGRMMDSNLPPKYVRSDSMQRANMGAYLPKRVRDDRYYIRTGIATERFTNSADGQKSLRKLLEAKEVHGSGNDGISDSVVFKTTVVSGFLGLVLGLMIFVLPAFL